MKDVREKRQYKRFPILIPATMVVTQGNAQKSFEVELRDISLGGAFIHGMVPIVLGQQVKLKLHWDKMKLLEAKVIDGNRLPKIQSNEQGGMVKWVRGSSSSGFGVEFVNLSEDQKKYIQQLIAELDKTKT